MAHHRTTAPPPTSWSSARARSGLASPPVPVYRDAAGEFARFYLPDGATGFVVRPDGQLGARFPLGGAAAVLGDCLRALSVRPRDA
ncbi:hypothetical protein ACWDUX_31010 [Streptomyces sp. NPDC003444]